MRRKIIPIGEKKIFNCSELAQQYEQIFETACDAIFILDTAADGVLRFIDSNGACERFFGIDTSTAAGKTINEVLPRSSAAALNEYCRRCTEYAAPVSYDEVKQYPFGDCHFTITLTPIVDETGNVYRIIGTTHDITSSKLSEKRLKESEQLYRELFELEADAILLVDTQSDIILEANQMALTVYGYSRKELVGMKHVLLCADPAEVFCIGDTRGGNASMRWHKRKCGETFPVEITASFISKNEREVMIAAVRDVSGRVRAEEERDQLINQLIQSQKMEALGQLAAGIAHDFNNILTVMLGYCHILMTRIKDDDNLSVHAEQILLSANRAAELTGGLLAFSRQQPLSTHPVEIADVIQATEKTFRQIIREDITFTVSVPGYPLVVRGDKCQIDQILLNLIANAIDAMPNGGSLSLSAEKVNLPDGIDNGPEKLAPGDYAVISVADTGRGITKEAALKIFDPFFTTKPQGKGTGLGLTIVCGIANRHNGLVRVDSTEGIGTTFRVYIPLAKPEHPMETRPVVTRPTATGSETILVAEDDVVLGNLVTGILEGAGYKVMLAQNGEQVLRELDQHRSAIRLVILDVVMPKTDINSLIETLKSQLPETKVVFTSGYSEEIVKGKGIDIDAAHFFGKPYKPHDFLKMVRETLDG